MTLFRALSITAAVLGTILATPSWAQDDANLTTIAPVAEVTAPTTTAPVTPTVPAVTAQKKATPQISVQWRDLNSVDRRNILLEWKALPVDSRPPFIEYRQQAIDKIDAAKMKEYQEKATVRTERRQAIEKAYQEKIEQTHETIKETIEASQAKAEEAASIETQATDAIQETSDAIDAAITDTADIIDADVDTEIETIEIEAEELAVEDVTETPVAETEDAPSAQDQALDKAKEATDKVKGFFKNLF